MSSRLTRVRRPGTIRSNLDIWYEPSTTTTPPSPPSSSGLPTDPHRATLNDFQFPSVHQLYTKTPSPQPSLQKKVKPLWSEPPKKPAFEVPLSWRDPDYKTSKPPETHKLRDQRRAHLSRQAMWGTLGLVVLILGALYLINPASPATEYKNPMQTKEELVAKTSAYAQQQRLPSFRDSLEPDAKYLTSPYHGTFAHQVMSLYHLIYLSTILSRKPIIPLFSFPQHNSKSRILYAASSIFDMERFGKSVNVSTIDWRDVRPPVETRGTRLEQLGCWAAPLDVDHLKERWTGMRDMGLDTSFYPLRINKPLGSDLNDLQIAYSFLAGFDRDPGAQAGLIDQALHSDAVTTFSTSPQRDPERQVFCVDHSLFHTTFAARTVDHLDKYEHNAFRAHGVALRFVPELEKLAADVVSFVLGHSSPFIGVHISSPATSSSSSSPSSSSKNLNLVPYVEAIENIKVVASQVSGPSIHRKTREYRHQIRSLNVLVTTDVRDIGVLGEMINMGWTLLDYDDLEIRARYDGWPRQVVDSAVLSRASAFVGTDGCAESTLTALRVRSWKAGPVALV